MTIQSTEQALAVINSVKSALNQLVVQGRENCYIVVACGNDLDSVAEYLNGEFDAEKIISGKENDE